MSGPVLPIFEIFPEVKALGEPRLQELCDSWRQTSVAKEFALTTTKVAEVDGKLSLVFDFALTHAVSDGDEYFFPTDELLHFIVDNAQFTAATKSDLRRRIITGRQRGGPNVYRRFVIHPGFKLRLFFTCPACGDVIQTQLRAYRNEIISMDPEEVQCPACDHRFTIDGHSLHFEPGA